MEYTTIDNDRINDLEEVCQQLSKLCLADDVDADSQEWQDENPMLFKYYNALYIYNDITGGGLSNPGPVEIFKDTFDFEPEQIGWVPLYTDKDERKGDVPANNTWRYEGIIPNTDYDKIAEMTESKLREIIGDAAQEQSISASNSR